MIGPNKESLEKDELTEFWGRTVTRFSPFFFSSQLVPDGNCSSQKLPTSLRAPCCLKKVAARIVVPFLRLYNLVNAG